MKYAIKNKEKIAKAYCLGEGSEMEQLLIRLGRIRLLPDGGYELMSQEANNGVGQKAKAGDYFKVDDVNGVYYPYPNGREYFLNNHTHLDGDLYEHKEVALAIWQCGDSSCDVLEYLLEQGKLRLDYENEDRFFNAFLWGTDLSAAQTATLVFYEIIREASGVISDVIFNFVAKDEFERCYTICYEEDCGLNAD